MKSNKHAEFVGIEALKARHRQQLDDFELWAKRGKWLMLHDVHYDWWMFPIDEPSRGYGYGYTIYEDEVAVLKQDAAFMRNLALGTELVTASWGWDLRAGQYIANPVPGQSWHNWPVRLSKAARSMLLFGLTDHFASLKTYALILIKQGKDMTFGGRDVSWPFTTGINPRR
jgi:hypothetical protein